MTKLSIVILTFNSELYIKNCLLSIFKFYEHELKTGEFEIVLFDNNSQDATKEQITSFLSRIPSAIQSNTRVFFSGENLGFARGINTAVTQARGEYFLFLNPDTQVQDGNIMLAVDEFNKNARAGILGGKMIKDSGTEELSAGTFYNFFQILVLALGLERFSNFRSSPKEKKIVDFVSGGFMVTSRAIFEKLHGFNEHYFMYVEDMDFCYRAKKIGYLTLFTTEISVKHHGQGSSSRDFAILEIYKGILSFYKTYKDKRSYFLVKSLLRAKALAAISFGTLTANSELTNTYKKTFKF